jgi:drug/metabolite transporter (DMT)-like permease
MQNVRLKNYIHLHFLVFIAGFTAIIGEIVNISSIPLVWYRMLIAGLLMFTFIILTKQNYKPGIPAITRFSLAGILIALHWITFFEAINQSNVSITLAMFSTGAFFASLIEPLFFRRKIIKYEILFGILVVIGVALITQSELKYINGILLGIVSALFSTLFAVINGQFVKNYAAPIISLYEFLSGVFFITLFILFSNNGFSREFFTLSTQDWIYLLILSSVCTAYAFIASVHVMRYVTPYTVMLTYNLEPVYGIFLALLFFPEKEKMSPAFYFGLTLILSTVILNGILKNRKQVKRKTTV